MHRVKTAIIGGHVQVFVSEESHHPRDGANIK